MNPAGFKITEERLAVCSWSLQPAGCEDLIAKLTATGITRVQLALDPLREKPAAWENLGPALRPAGIEVVSGMFGCIGEDYSTLLSIRETGGIAPDATWSQNLENIQAAAALASQLGLSLVTFHAGFLPHDEADPAFTKRAERLRIVADIFAAQAIQVGLETGQETAAVLAALLTKLDRPNLGVNFDPANMILYGKGDPIAAVGKLGPWIRQVHVKDARLAKIPETWGDEVVVGTGEVDWRRFFSALMEVGFTGDCVIEREAGFQRLADIRAAREFLLNGNR